MNKGTSPAPEPDILSSNNGIPAVDVPVASDIVLTTYFTGKPDPQASSKRKTNLIKHAKTWLRSRRGGAVSEIPGVAGPDEFRRIEVWYRSLQAVGCNAVIFHDELSDGFTQQWQNEHVRFEHYALQTPRSVNDERYQCYYQFLERHPEVQRIFMMDLFDIEFFKDPFTLFDDEHFDIYCGGDADQYNNQLNREKMLKAFGEPHYEDQIKLNAGILGGRRDVIMPLLETMMAVFDGLTERGELFNLNMPIFNKCVYDHHNADRIMTGYPLNSRFKKYERTGNFALRHK